MEICLNSEKLLKISAKGLTWEDYIGIILIKNREFELFNNNYSKEFSELVVGGWLQPSFKVLTPKSLKLIEEIEGKDVKIDKVENLRMIYDRILVKFVELTGKKQKMIDGKYPFICNYVDFSTKLSKVIKKYKLSDVKKMEKVLIAYIIRAKNANFVMCPTLEYYIEKNNSSRLVSDYESFIEERDENVFKSQQKFV